MGGGRAMGWLAVLAACLAAGCAVGHQANGIPSTSEAYREADQGALRASPRVLGHDQTLTLTMPVPHPASLAIRDPDGRWFYLQDPAASVALVPPEAFARLRELALHPAEITGLVFVGGEPLTGLVFTKAGEYLIYLAENLETEPENTWSMQTTVHFGNDIRGPAPRD